MKIKRSNIGPLVWMAAAAALWLAGCQEARQPPYHEILEVRGTPYERGYQQGRQFSSKIRSLYTRFLDTSLLPFLNREHAGVAAFLTGYQDRIYQNGQFSYQVLLQSGQNLEKYLLEHYPEYPEEMHGIADGAGLPYEKILVLNTFFDSLLAFRAIAFFINNIQGPKLVEVEFLGGLDSDGIDNNGDGNVDEADDGKIKDYLAESEGWTTVFGPKPYASLVEVPPGASIRLYLEDAPSLAWITGDPDQQQPRGIDPDTVRIQLGTEVFEGSADCIQTQVMGEEGEGLEVVFTPPGGLPEASAVSLVVQAGNLSRITEPPPLHARFMRDQRITFTTRGDGRPHHQVPNRGEDDGRSQPPALGFAVRGSASADQRIRLGHNFGILDTGVAHQHTALVVHHPDQGRTHAILSWTGLVWGSSGMNQDGLSYMFTTPNSLDNPLAGQVRQDLFDAKLLLTGIPVGIMGRILLERAETVEDALELLRGMQATFGWNLLLGDRDGDMAAVEMDANILGDPDDGFHSYRPEADDPANLDPFGRPWASTGPDDLRIGSHFRKNDPDIQTQVIFFDVPPQRYWCTFYLRSLRAFFILGQEIHRRHGNIGLDQMKEILRVPDLVDIRDSMNAVVFEPEGLKLHFAMGQVPATDGEFIEFDLGAALGGDR